MTTLSIPFNKPYLTGNEISSVQEAIIRSELSGDGHFTSLCTNLLESSYNAVCALLTPSCTAALEMSAILANIQPGDEIIMPAYTFVSTANAFVLRGGIPVFVDVRNDNWNLDETLIEAAVTSRTRAIVAVHYAGVPCEMDEIMRIAKKHALIVIEDAAQAIGATYKGRALGTIGDVGCLSFHATKNVICGEGGALLVNHSELAARAEIIREKGTNRASFLKGEVDKYTWVSVGSSFLPNELTAAFLWPQLAATETINAARLSNWALYSQGLENLEKSGKITRQVFEGNGHMFGVLIDDSAQFSRWEVIQNLKLSGILAASHYVPLHSSPAGVRYGKVSGTMTNTESVGKRWLRLPLYPDLAPDQVARVVSALEDSFE